MVTAGIFPLKESSHGRAGNRTLNLMISSQRLWPLDHEAGHHKKRMEQEMNIGESRIKSEGVRMRLTSV